MGMILQKKLIQDWIFFWLYALFKVKLLSIKKSPGENDLIGSIGKLNLPT